VAKGGLREGGAAVEKVEALSLMKASAVGEGMAVDDADASSEG
jgi:hypothetical protein